MKRSITILSLFAILILISGVASAQFGPGANRGSQTPRAYGDANGDGICDLTGQPVGAACGQGQGQGQRQGNGKRYGAGDGSGNAGSGSRDGSGYGAGNGNRGGICDGTGPKRGSGSVHRGRGGRR